MITFEGLLAQILWRMDDPNEGYHVVTAPETERWPAGIVARLHKESMLVEAGLSQTAACPECVERHVEEIETLKSPSGGVLRFYISCPLVGRARIDPSSLRQWRLRPEGWARFLAKRLGVSGTVKELVPAHLWELGRGKLGDTTYDLFLGRGLAVQNAKVAVVGHLRNYAEPVLLTLLPVLEKLECGIVVPLGRLVRLGPRLWNFDHRYLHQFLIQRARVAVQPQYAIVRQGDYWKVTFEGRELRMRGTVGLEYLAYLLAHPGQEVSAVELSGLTRKTASPRAGALPDASWEQAAEAGLNTIDADEQSPLIDAQTRRQVWAKVKELDEDIAEAEANNDTGRLPDLRAEKDKLVHYLSSALGIGGKARKMKSPHGRAINAVAQALGREIRQLEKQDPALGAHLRRTVRTGRFCIYSDGSLFFWQVVSRNSDT